MKKIQLKKGVNLYLFPDKKFKTYFAGIYVHAPLKKETATENALLPLILKRGSKNYPTKSAISERLDMLMGASFHSYAQKIGERQLLCFLISGVSDSFSPYEDTFKGGLSLIYDITFNPLFPISSSYLESEKQHLKELIESERNDKRAYASLRCSEEMTKGEAYSVHENGYIEHLPKITEKSLENHYHSAFEAYPVDIIISGSFDEEKAVSFMSELSSSLKDRCDNYPKTSPCTKEDLTTITESMDVSQGKLCIGFSAPQVSEESNDYPAYLVYNSIFGGGAHSKLFMNVREKLSLAYYAGSKFDSHKGIIMVSSGIETKNYEKAKEEILLQHKAMSDGDITENELSVSKKSLINNLRASKDSVMGLASFNLTRIIKNSNLSIEKLCEKIDGVTTDDVTRVGKNIAPKLIYLLKGAER